MYLLVSKKKKLKMMKNRQINRQLKLLQILIIPFLLITTSISKTENPVDETIKLQGEKLKYLLSVAYNNFPDSIDIEKISNIAFDAILSELDTQSDYYTTDEYHDIKNRNKGQKEGCGFDITVVDDSIRIYAVDDTGPAAAEGLTPGDYIIYAGGEAVAGKGFRQVQDLIVGEPGSILNLVVRKFDTYELKEYKLKRKRLQDRNLKAAFILPGTNTAVIRISRFSAGSAEEFESALSELTNQGADNLIIDLRSNPGGLLDKAGDITSLFLEKGKLISTTKSRSEQYRKVIATEKDGQYLDMPVVVVVNEASASGSEVIAGALQDHDRAIVIGSRTFGKGSIQKLWEFTDGSAFKLTIGNYLTPLGRNIEHDPKYSFMNKIGANSSKEDITNIIQDVKGKVQMPVFETPAGRRLLGGGCIFPDKLINPDSTTQLTNLMHSRQIITEFVFDYLRNNKKELLKKYRGVVEFERNFKFEGEFLNNFTDFCKSKDAWNDDMFMHDRELIGKYVRGFIAQTLWSELDFNYIMLSNDKFIIAAHNLQENAKELLTLRKK